MLCMISLLYRAIDIERYRKSTSEKVYVGTFTNKVCRAFSMSWETCSKKTVANVCLHSAANIRDKNAENCEETVDQSLDQTLYFTISTASALPQSFVPRGTNQLIP